MEDQVYLIALGMKISFLRKQKGLTQPELAAQVGCAKTQMVRIERGQTNSTINMLRSIATVFEMPVEELVKV